MRLSRHVLLSMLLLLCSCSSLTEPFSFRERQAFIQARARWNVSDVRNAYRYEVRQSCFCPPEVTSWNTVTVVNDSITDVRTATGEVVPASSWRYFSTVEDLFARLDTPDDDYLRDITVQFDVTYGYPLRLSFAYDADVLDAGVEWTARNLAPLPMTIAR